MDTKVLESLFSTLDRLERGVLRAKFALGERKVISFDLVQRLSSYESSLSKQRDIASELYRHLRNKDLEKIAQLTAVLVGLAEQVQGDANEVLSELDVKETEPKKAVILKDIEEVGISHLTISHQKKAKAV